MYPKISVNLGNLVLSLSDALDLASPYLAMHQQRTAFVAWELGRAAGLPDKRLERVFLTGLLHDIGALSIEEKAALRSNETVNVDWHCVRGQSLFESNPWLAPCADLVRNHHRDWDQWDEPRDRPEVFDAQLLRLADDLERNIDRGTYILHQSEAQRARIKDLAGTVLSPGLVDLFMDVSRREEFWLDLASPRLYSLLLHHGPFQTIELDLDNIELFAKLVSVIVDFKSRFTSTHSAGVARCAVLLAQLAGMSQSEVRLMGIAGMLHDLGKLVIPNAILDKPAGLTKEEFAVIKQHTYYTFSILCTINGFQTIAEWGAYHHERLDGAGYPFRRSAAEMSLGSRVMAVADIFTALAEERPYRPGMEPERIATIMREQASRNIIDARLVGLLLENVQGIRQSVSEKQAEAAQYYGSRFLEPWS